MSGIAGFYNANEDFLEFEARSRLRLDDMGTALKKRGPDGSGSFLSDHAGLVHNFLNTGVSKESHQPFLRTMGGRTYALIFDGACYNGKELRSGLSLAGWNFDTDSDAETLLYAYIEYGPDAVNRVNGVFAMAIWDPDRNHLFLCRDRSGIKPLFYTRIGDTYLFASELKGIFAYPGTERILNTGSLNEVFSLGPARTPGCGVFKDISEVKPAHYLLVGPDGMKSICYWKLESHPHEDSYEETIEKTSFLLKDAVLRQMSSGTPPATFLSGGIDSSVVSAICSEELIKQGRRLDTFSFDFVDNDKNFRSNAFQPSLDKPFVEQMVTFLHSDHRYLECSHTRQAELLSDSVKAHDLPPMGDIDSSMLYFCNLVQKENKTALTGECADEIFGGYPWFHREDCLKARTFPWTMDLEARKILLKDDFIDQLSMDGYVRNAYETSISQTPRLPGEDPLDARRREISWLNLQWFMQTLLNRMDRTSASAGLEARVPFADHRIIEYLWNVPWDMKARDGVVKNLLRQASKGLVPDEILFRRKSPYPKTYDTRYEKLLAGLVEEMMHDPSSPVMDFLDKKKLKAFIKSPSDYGKPWYGQLMAGPQMLAYILQMNEWLAGCRIRI